MVHASRLSMPWVDRGWVRCWSWFVSSSGGRPPWTQHRRLSANSHWPGSLKPVISLTPAWRLNCSAERWISHSQDRPAFPLRVLYCFQPAMASGFSALDEPTMNGMNGLNNDLSPLEQWCCSCVVRTGAISSGQIIFHKKKSTIAGRIMQGTEWWSGYLWDRSKKEKALDNEGALDVSFKRSRKHKITSREKRTHYINAKIIPIIHFANCIHWRCQPRLLAPFHWVQFWYISILE